MSVTEALISAIRSLDVTKVEQLLKSDLETESRKEAHYSALHIAVNKIDVAPNKLEIERIIEVLLESGGFNVNALADDCQTALHLAIKHCQCTRSSSHDDKDMANAVIKILLNNNANINAKTSLGETPLITASDRGCSHIVQLLLDWKDELSVGADVNARDIYGETALIKAAKSAHVDVVKLLLQHGCLDEFQDHRGYYALHAVIYGPGRMDEVSSDYLQSIGVDASEKTIKMLDQYGANGLGQVIRNNLHRNNDIQKIVRMLVTRGQADINSPDFRGNTVLDLAVKSKIRVSQETVDMLMKSGAHFCACMNKGSSNPDKNADKLGKTPLHRLAVALPEITAMERLDVKGSETLLDNSPFKELFEAMAVTKDHRGRTALHYAMKSKAVDYYDDALILRNAFKLPHIFNERDNYERTPLHYCDDEYLCELFVTKGANEHIQDIDGKTPQDLRQLRRKESNRYDLPLMVNRMLTQLHVDDDKYNNYECKNKVYEDDAYMYEEWTDDQRKIEEHNSNHFPLELIVAAMSVLTQNDERRQYKCSHAEYMDNEHKDDAYEKWTIDKRKFEDLSIQSKIDAWFIWKYSKYEYRAHCSTIMRDKVQQFISKLSDEVRKKDPRFECMPVLVGSVEEGTKIGLPDEFDFNFVLTKLSEMCEVVPSPEAPSGFVQLKRRLCSSECQPTCEGFQTQEGYNRLFNSSGFLMTTETASRFRIVCLQIMSEQEFWDGENVFEWDTCSEMGLVKENEQYYDSEIPNDLRPSTHLCTNIRLKLNRPIEGIYLFTEISLDIVPCIKVNSWWPDDALPNVNDEIKLEGCHLVFDQPQRKYPWVPFSDPFARISFAPAESRIIKECSAVARAAYMVCKQLLCFYDKSNLTYVLKTCLQYCIGALKNNTRNSLLYEDIDPTELRYFVEKLMLCFHEFYLQDFAPCYLMPSFHLPIEEYLKSNHDQLISESISQYPMFAYKLYKILCITESPVDFCLPTPEPLNERFNREELMRRLPMRRS